MLCATLRPQKHSWRINPISVIEICWCRKTSYFYARVLTWGLVKILIGLWFLMVTEWRFVSLNYLIFWNIWKIFCSVWYLMLAFVLWMLSKIFRANISTYVNFSWRLCLCLHDDVGIWWLGCNASFLLTFGWRKGAAADASFGWRKNAVSMLALDGEKLQCKM